jgi:hypothetical protein
MAPAGKPSTAPSAATFGAASTVDTAAGPPPARGTANCASPSRNRSAPANTCSPHPPALSSPKAASASAFLRQPFLRKGGNDPWVITTPWVLDPDTLLVAAGLKNHEMIKGDFPKDPVDLGIYTMNVETGEITMVYNDPASADFEARPLHPRKVPPVLAESPATRQGGFTGSLLTQSAFLTREPHLVGRGKLIRIIEGLPQVTRHATHTTPGEEAWKNHGGTFGRDLATLPLASDGSFAAEVPADRFLHLQVLDSDRNVVGNQLLWMNVRPNERMSCIGCHEPAEMAPPNGLLGQAFFHPDALLGGSLPEALPDGPPKCATVPKCGSKATPHKNTKNANAPPIHQLLRSLSRDCALPTKHPSVSGTSPWISRKIDGSRSAIQLFFHGEAIEIRVSGRGLRSSFALRVKNDPGFPSHSKNRLSTRCSSGSRDSRQTRSPPLPVASVSPPARSCDAA